MRRRLKTSLSEYYKRIKRAAGLWIENYWKYGICWLFSDRMGFHSLCKRTWDRSGTWSWFRSRKYRFLLFGDHRYRSDPVSTAVWTFLKSRTCIHARYRRGFLLWEKTGSHWLCCKKIRERSSSTDHHFWNYGCKSRDPWCRKSFGYSICKSRWNIKDGSKWIKYYDR